MTPTSDTHSYQVVEWGKPLQKVLGKRPLPKGAEIVVEVELCGVCHSDAHLQEGHYDLGRGKTVALEALGIQRPLTMGHEIVGRVSAAGPDAGVEIGAQGVVFPWIGCGTCTMCRRGAEIDCPTPQSLGTRRPGGYARHVLVPDPRYFVPLDGVDPQLAASAACSGVTAYSALRKLPVLTEEDVVVVLGVGGLGQAALGLASHVTQARIVAVDQSREKVDIARCHAAGAWQVDDPDAQAAIRALAGGGVAAVIDFVGRPETLEWALQMLRKGGMVVEVGLFGGGFELPVPWLPMRNLCLRGSYVGSLSEFHELMALLRNGARIPTQFEQRPMDDLNPILDALRAGAVKGRVMVQP